ncbi:hypothetical protein BC938DRAFT_471339 [Jimgerdemannia flammicorona]|uniref:Uncharacterized protein n=2 Tax=Jimgerdemannia flammicorona TaxID=994334 RepID=A0A433R050_9FUNG|nr:hypothetical protein BC938DRAFT_471339 [Jimgerdemannia flammicorona]
MPQVSASGEPFCRLAVLDDLQSVEGTIPVSEITSSSPQSKPTKSRATSSTPNVSEPQPTPERDASHGGIFANSQLTISKSGDPAQIAFQLGRELGRMEGQFVAFLCVMERLYSELGTLYEHRRIKGLARQIVRRIKEEEGL